MPGLTIDRDLGWKRIKRDVALMEKSSVRVGFLVSGPSRRETGLPNAAVAYFNEYGTRTIPERPFMRQSMDENLERLHALVGVLIDSVLLGATSVKTALGLLGQTVQGLIQEKIAHNDFEANAPSTIAAKGSSQPLVDSAQMRQSVRYLVEMAGSAARAIFASIEYLASPVEDAGAE
jgi:hypothetical protein